jgi:hypothetical protein
VVKNRACSAQTAESGKKEKRIVQGEFPLFHSTKVRKAPTIFYLEVVKKRVRGAQILVSGNEQKSTVLVEFSVFPSAKAPQVSGNCY